MERSRNQYNSEHPEVVRLARRNYNAKVRQAAKYAGLGYREFLRLPLEERTMIFRVVAEGEKLGLGEVAL